MRHKEFRMKFPISRIRKTSLFDFVTCMSYYSAPYPFQCILTYYEFYIKNPLTRNEHFLFVKLVLMILSTDFNDYQSAGEVLSELLRPRLSSD